MKVTDYLFCEDCQEYCDLYKYDNINNTNHQGCNWRYVTEEEKQDLVRNCEADGCFCEVDYDYSY